MHSRKLGLRQKKIILLLRIAIWLLKELFKKWKIIFQEKNLKHRKVILLIHFIFIRTFLHSHNKLCEIRKKVMNKNYLLHKYLQLWFATFFHRMYIFLFNLKAYYRKSRIQFFNNNVWNTKKTEVSKNFRFNNIYKFCLT